MPWCPRCGAEYVEGVKTCADCNVLLRDVPPLKDAPVSREPPPLSRDVQFEEKDWVPIVQANNIQEAEMLIGLLDSKGIYAVIRDHLGALRQLYGGFSFFDEKINIYVLKEKAEEAVAVIREDTGWVDEDLGEAMSDEGGFEDGDTEDIEEEDGYEENG